MTTDPAQGLPCSPRRFQASRRPSGPGFVVAVPVKDEEERLPACLRALAQQRDQLGQPIPPTLVRIVVFANNCSDRSASLARKLGGGLSLDVRVVEARLPPAVAHAGSARRAVMDLAEAWLVEAGEKDGVILTTDADSQVAPNWIAENLAAFADGAEAVLGRIDLDEEGAFLPEALHRRGGLEDTYERLLAELSWLLDPLDHNPWPHHATISGASLGVTRAAYCRVGRLPRVPLGEDKALIGLLSRQDARIRYCSTAHVITSGRTHGRAPGGVADTLAIRSREPDAFCDDALEPFRAASARASWRGRLRRLHAAGRLALDQDWAAKLGISDATSMTSSKSPHSARRGTLSRIEAHCLRVTCSDRRNCRNRSLSRVVRSALSRRRVKRATRRPNETQHIDPPARRRRPVRFVR